MCATKCAKPVRPSRSFPEPTWYQRLTATIGAVRSSESVTRRPLLRRYVSTGMCTADGYLLYAYEGRPASTSDAPLRPAMAKPSPGYARRIESPRSDHVPTYRCTAA